MRIGEFARRGGVNVETVRYYERRDLLRDPRGRTPGYREYDDGMLERLWFIRRAQELGFTLAEIGELLALRVDESTSAGEVKQRAERKIAQIDDKVRDLQRIRRALQHLTGQCRGGGTPIGDCPLLEALGGMART